MAVPAATNLPSVGVEEKNGEVHVYTSGERDVTIHRATRDGRADSKTHTVKAKPPVSFMPSSTAAAAMPSSKFKVGTLPLPTAPDGVEPSPRSGRVGARRASNRTRY